MCQECQEIEVGYSESSEAWDQTVEYKSEETLLNSGIKEEVSGKVCTKCGEWKPFEEFGKDKNKKDEHNIWCKTCVHLYSNSRINRVKFLKKCIPAGKVCSVCGIWKEASLFYLNKRTKDGLEYCCICCEKEKKLKYLEEKKRKLGVEDLSVFRICSLCGKEKLLSEFHINIAGKLGRNSSCAECVAKRCEKYRMGANFKPDLSIFKFCSQCKILKSASEFYLTPYHKDGLESCCKVCHNKNACARIKNNVEARISNALRRRLSYFVKRGDLISKDVAIDFLGCTMPEFIEYIENQFYDDPKSGRKMCWENYGCGEGRGDKYGWDFEHSVPLSRVNLLEEDQVKFVCEYHNIRPMWGWQNRKKHNKLLSEMEAGA